MLVGPERTLCVCFWRTTSFRAGQGPSCTPLGLGQTGGWGGGRLDLPGGHLELLTTPKILDLAGPVGGDAGQKAQGLDSTCPPAPGPVRQLPAPAATGLQPRHCVHGP